MAPEPAVAVTARERGPTFVAIMAPAALLYVVLRLPSFFEPYWYPDEAGYTSEGRALLHGALIYNQAWNNKPPLHLWTIAVDYAIFGPSEVGLHLLTLLTGLAALTAAAYAATRLLSWPRAAFAVLLATLALGTPLMGAELALPESLLIAGTSWAGAIVLTHVRTDGRLWPVAAGLAAALALGYQQTVIADIAALSAIIVFAGHRPWVKLVLFLSAAAALTAAWLVPTVIIAGPSRVAYSLVDFFVPFTAEVHPLTGSGLLLDGFLLIASTALILAGCALVRTREVRVWGTWMWSGATILIASAAHQPYAHYLLPAVVPGCLAVASIPLPPRPARRDAAASVSIGLAILIAMTLASVVRDQWTWASVFTYYRGAAGVVADRWSLTQWQDHFGEQVPSDRAACGYVRSHGLAGSSAVVWSSDAWPYMLCDLPLALPTGPIYNDEVLIGCAGPLADRVAELDPELIITSTPALRQYPEIEPLLSARYQRVFRSGRDQVWVRDPDARELPWSGAGRGPATCLPPSKPKQRGLFSSASPAGRARSAVDSGARSD
ncbi:MAG TPA: glycosyltransferase family 39 protein [Candidatus Dormibacteraeota bacterium]|jgi:4-amino-4-deoxy-L-arabinose transferase-like glycosyltransferase|nr:glycosyltransferase family 39 protein [Candidatus Dormibacteraeota bacterium]